MGWLRIAVLLVAFQATSLLLPPGAAAEDFLSPLFSPALNPMCDFVQCGKGSCQVSLNHAFGFVCNCDDGWSQFHIDDHLRFLPCVVPKCAVNYSCPNESLSPAPAPVPAPSNFPSIFNPCFWSFCGGGSCVKTSAFGHRCDCKEGFSNLLNVTSSPCFTDCSIGANCTKLGISLSNVSATSTPSSTSPNASSFSRADYSTRKNLLWLLFLMISLTMVGST